LLGWVGRGLGGVSISIGVPDSYVSKLNRLQEAALVPLLVTSDFENGGPGMRINHAYALPSLLPQGGGTSFPPTMAFGAVGDEELAWEYGRITALEARAVGVHWLFAPVMDVNSNPENPIINTRSFGEDPEAVGRLGTAFIRGAREGGALTTAKHFPGHGDTRTDSHVELPIVAADRDRLDRVELVPFRMAIDAGVDAVMTAHVAVPGVIGSNAPATLSPEFMTELLRDDLGFSGILFTDALRMGALTDGYGAGEAAVLAVEAGSDVLLAPADIGETVDAVMAAVESGRITRQRIYESVRRLLEAKARLGLHEVRTVSTRRTGLVVGAAEHMEVARDAAARALTLVRDHDATLPLPTGGRVLSVTFSREDDLLAGRTFNGTLRSYAREVQAARVGDGTEWPVLDSLLSQARLADAVVVSAYLPPRAGVGSGSVSPRLRSFMSRLTAMPGGPPVVLISFGSPYVLAAFPEAPAYLIAWGGREVPQEAAARALVGAQAVRGRLPVAVPPLHDAGEGLSRPAVAEVVAMKQRLIDPLQEAGFLPGENPIDGGAGPSGATGGPGLWTEGPPVPACPDGWAPPRWTPGTAPTTVAPRQGGAPGPASPGGAQPIATECRLGDLVASTRETDPHGAGMDAEALDELDRFIQDALADSAASGAALALVRHGRLVRLRGYGRLDWDPAAPPVTPSSIFDLASLTKVVGTTTAAVRLAQHGLLSLDDRVVDHLPWWRGDDPRKDDVTIRQLLVHQAGLPPFRRFFQDMQGRQAYENAIGDLALEYEPGTRTVYSDIGLMTVGFIVEAVSGMGLDGYLDREVWKPLGMGDTGFTPDSAQWHRVATTEVDDTYRDRKIHGVVHDENAHAIGGVVGHAGLFSSARDLAVFAHMMLGGGTVGPCDPEADLGVPCSGVRFAPVSVLGSGWVDWITRRQSGESSRAIGWDTPSEGSSAGDYFTARAFGHTGYTGTSIWMDPTLDLAVVLLTNRVNPTRENSRHIPLRRGVHDRAAQAILDRPVERRPGA
ncbi:MAG: serine hydrolase, partial [Gemmatimonadetes bacterium]|nr:serine hydrolase [Gemmatimonadota bacterium]